MHLGQRAITYRQTERLHDIAARILTKAVPPHDAPFTPDDHDDRRGRTRPDLAVIDRLWNPFIAVWFEGKNDPKLVLLGFDAERAQVWLNENKLLAGVKLMGGVDPTKNYSDKVADIDLR